MNTVLFPPPEPKLMHAPVSRPLITTWEASGRGWAGPPPGENAECNEAITSGAAKAQETASARTSAARSRAGEPRRRRVRAVTLAAFAIGGVILVGRAPHPYKRNYVSRAGYLILSFSPVATFLLAVASRLRMARMTMNDFFCQTTM